ncbi:DUF1330 domain-containing protein [Kiloniella sp. b19]|uniref:DUF1330 domain-containing protein n=1 Tax=Kiloniella sp. GXU_MW_B19 TaxID=3141326 RepID=UPI0031DB9B19
MVFEILVGLNVINEERYAAYRAAMKPLLHEYGGDFGYDFRVSEVLRSETDTDINRVFTLHFPDEDAQKAFFSDSNYLAVKKEFFDSSVGAATRLAQYQRQPS